MGSFLVLTCLDGTAQAAGPRPNAFFDRVDSLVVEGFERPDRAMHELQALQASGGRSPDEQRVLLQAMGSVAAQSGRAAQAGEFADRLLALSPEAPSALALASSNLIRAQVAESAGHLDVAAALAQSALPTLQLGCPGGVTPPGQESGDCAYRSTWRALQVLEKRAQSQGLSVTAAAHAQSGLALAEWAGDARRRASNLGALALYANTRGERELSQHLIAQAQHFVALTDSPVERARLANTEARLAMARGEHAAALQFYNEALAQATHAQATHLQATLLNNLSDAYGRMGRPADALRAAERALVLARERGAGDLERILINNAGIAKIGLGRIAEGKRDMGVLLGLWAQNGETGRQAATLLEFGQALATAGDAHGALDLYHRERTLSAELMQANRRIALKELQGRFESDARERDIELLARDNALKTAALANRDLLQRIWWLLAFVMLMAIALVTMLYRRVRETQRRLVASRVQLQAQSERDPLTQLANRRQFQSVMEKLCKASGFEGALLLVDIDHFKHINDRHGHAAGDRVLVEVSRRLTEAVRSADLVVRWGGEEFLVLAPRATVEQAEQIASRVLGALGRAPVDIGGDASVRVTASVGYGRFPLPPCLVEMPWEQAMNLADLALYAAKDSGRNRSVGIVSTTAATAEALRDIATNFDLASLEGRVTLARSCGPRVEEVPTFDARIRSPVAASLD